MKIAYITAQTPYGPGEAFILPEVLELRRRGHEVTVFPLRPEKVRAQGAEAAGVAEFTVRIPLLNAAVILRALKLAAARPGVTARILGSVLHGSGSVKKLLKNLAVIPKGLVLGEEAWARGIEHIHAHWASTPSTAAYIASLWSGVPWSFTAHRWDIAEGNMLREKAASSNFIRAINCRGAEELKLQLPAHLRDKVLVVHVGVNLPSLKSRSNPSTNTVACVANLIPVKGHEYLIKASSVLKQRGLNIKYVLFGDGHLRGRLQELVHDLGLEAEIEFRGAVPHDEVLKLYATGSVSLLVLPSIETSDGEKEGIPVALMEAMAAGIPVVSTTTGGIPELLGDGAGVLVPPADPLKLAEAIQQLLENPAFAIDTARKGRKRVEEAFALEAVAKKLEELFSGKPCDTSA